MYGIDPGSSDPWSVGYGRIVDGSAPGPWDWYSPGPTPSSRTRRPRRGLTVGVIVAVAVAVIAPQLNHGSSPAVVGSAGIGGVKLPGDLSAVTDATSTNWSGYVAQSSADTEQLASIAAQWTVPSVTCKPGESSSVGIWIGLGGSVHGDTLFQTGTDSACRSGMPVYYAWYEVFPGAPEQFVNQVSSGDRIVAHVSALAQEMVISIQDDGHTGRQLWSTSDTELPTGHPPRTAECILEDPSSAEGKHHQVPFAQFSLAEFQRQSTATRYPCTVTSTNGQAYALGGWASGPWPVTRLTMVDASQNVKATPSQPSSDGRITFSRP